MNKLIGFAFALIAVGFISCSDSTAPTDPSSPLNKTEQVREEIDTWTWNDCCGQLMSLEGYIHWVIKDDGDMHINGSSIVATDEDGNEYHGNLVQNQNIEVNDDGSGCLSWIVNYNFSGPGDCDFSAKVRLRYCIDADGNITYTQEVYDLECIY